ncbi:MAG: hypothetical protein ABI824_13115 [Acidobacteriota bacterium]
MKQALAALLGAGITCAACYAVGVLFIQRLLSGVQLRRIERFPLAFTLGAACIHLFVFTTLAIRAAYWPLLIGFEVAAIVWAIRSGAWAPQGLESNKLSRSLRVLIALVGGAFFTVYFFNAWEPEHSPDGAAYHLGLIARELHAHRFEYITSTIYAMLSQGVELVYLPAFAIGRHSAVPLVHLCFAVSLALAMFAYGRRRGKPWVGAAAALLTFLSPVVGRDASIAYNDVATAAIVFSVFYWLEIWDASYQGEQRDWRLLIPVGLLSGYSYAAKYTAFSIAIYAIGFVLWRTRRLKPVLLVTGCAIIMAGPWVARNWIVYQNPVAPLGNWLFHNPNVHVRFEQEYSEYLQRYGVENKWNLAKEDLIRGDKTQGLLGPIFFLLPLGLFALRYPTGRRLWLAGLIAFLPYFGNIGTRFLIPSLPFFSLLIPLAIGEVPIVLAGLIVLHAGLSWYPVIPRYAAPNAWRIYNIPYRAALRLTDPDEYLSQDAGYRVARMLERFVPEHEQVLAVSGFPDSYTSREILVGFQSARNELLTDILYMGWIGGNQDILNRSFKFPEQTNRRFRVAQIARATTIDQWNVHELRFFDKGVEIARKPQWRLRAWPNPWDVQLAFDNSPATRWRSWETASPGMYIEVDFGQDQAVDEVRVETSGDSPTVRMQVEMPGPSGEWKMIAERVHDTSSPPPASARRMATFELAARGIHYLVLYDTDFSAKDILEDPEAWGLKVVAEEGGAKLYRTIW